MNANKDKTLRENQRLFVVHHRNISREDEVSAIILTFQDFGEWLQEIQGAVKEFLKQQADKFKNKIKQLKKLNGSGSPALKQ